LPSGLPKVGSGFARTLPERNLPSLNP